LTQALLKLQPDCFVKAVMAIEFVLFALQQERKLKNEVEIEEKLEEWKKCLDALSLEEEIFD